MSAQHEMKTMPAGDVSQVNGDHHATSESRDAADLRFFGKRQRFKRNFGTFSIIGLTCTLMITWEIVLIANLPSGLLNGGTLGLVCSFMLAWVGVTSQVLVMAEMASMVPLSGGEYNWVAVLAPRSCFKFLSYLTGWITTIAWQATCATAVYLCGELVQGVAVLNHPDYVPTKWQTTLLFFAVILLCLLINTIFARFLPQAESGMLIIHILAFFGILIPLVYLGPRSSNQKVWGTWLNEGGWPSRGVTFWVGSTISMLDFIGIDGASHLAEEISDAASVIPKAMITAVTINGVTGFAMLLALVYRIGDIDDALNTPTNFPFMEIFQNAFRSTSSATGVIIVLIVTCFFASFGIIATASRMLWAFARERGVPFYSKVSLIHERSHLPLVSILITVVINSLLALINIGSEAAFVAFTSLTVAAFYASYFIAASVMLYKRLTEDTTKLRWGPFRLGYLGIPITIFSLCYTAVAFVWQMFPQATPTDAVDMNYASLMFGATLLFAMGYWLIYARRVYTGPVIEIDPEEIYLNNSSTETKDA